MGKVILHHKKFNSILLITVFAFNLSCDSIWFKKFKHYWPCRWKINVYRHFRLTIQKSRKYPFKCFAWLNCSSRLSIRFFHLQVKTDYFNVNVVIQTSSIFTTTCFMWYWSMSKYFFNIIWSNIKTKFKKYILKSRPTAFINLFIDDLNNVLFIVYCCTFT